MAVAGTAVQPNAYLRRSFVYRTLQSLGARFAEVSGAAVAMEFTQPVEAEAAQARRLGLADLSPLPRTGFKGAGTNEFLAAQGLQIGVESNRAYPLAGGALAARLAPSEVFLLDGLAGTGEIVSRLNGAWAWGQEKPRRPVGYPMPRAESHGWFAISGEQAPAMFAKICGIDLRLHKFAPGAIAQTSIAKMSGIIVRQDLGTTPAFYLLADSASAEYLWHGVTDAMAEFRGAPVGLSALRRLAGIA